MQPVLSLDHVKKTYGHKPVLLDCSTQVGAGQTVAIVGENGAGKSTLLKIIVGLLRADSGTVTWHGRLGYCPQELLIYERLTVWENLLYFGAAYGLDTEATARASEYLFEQLNLAAYRREKAGNLSGGTKQKLNLSLALIHDPELLVLDEPYQGFDYETYMAFLKLMDDLKHRGKSILIVTHLATDTVHFDRIITLAKGTLKDEPHRVAIAIQMMLLEFFRKRLIQVMLVVVPLLMIVSVYADLPKANMLLTVVENAVSFKKVVDQRNVTIVFITLFSISFLAAFFGFYLMLAARQVDRRLILCGYNPIEIVAARSFILVVLCAFLALYVNLILLPFFVVQNMPSFLGGLFFCSLIYGFYGELVGVMIKHELEGTYVVMLLPFIDTGYLEIPGFSTVLNAGWLKLMPGYFPSRIVADAGFTKIFDVGHEYLGAAFVAATLWFCASTLFWSATRRHLTGGRTGGHSMAKVAVVGVVVLALLGAGLYVAWPYIAPAGVAADGRVIAPHADVTTLWSGRIQQLLAEEGDQIQNNQQLALITDSQTGEIHSLRTPLAGVVTKVGFRRGENVVPGDVLFQVHDLTRLSIQLDVEEMYMAQVGVGDAVTLHVSDLSQPLQGHVTSIGYLPSVDENNPTGLLNSSDTTVRKYPVDVALDAAPQRLRLDIAVHGVIKGNP